MGFDTKKFNNTKFSKRTKEVLVPDLADFFNESNPVWVVRNLYGEEVWTTKNVIPESKSQLKAIDLITGDVSSEEIEKLKIDLKAKTKLAPGVAERTESLVLGSVDPVCDHIMAVKIRQHYPVVFYELTTEIARLTGLGSQLGKPKGSGKTQGPGPQ